MVSVIHAFGVLKSVHLPKQKKIVPTSIGRLLCSGRYLSLFLFEKDGSKAIEIDVTPPKTSMSPKNFNRKNIFQPFIFRAHFKMKESSSKTHYFSGDSRWVFSAE